MSLVRRVAVAHQPIAFKTPLTIGSMTLCVTQFTATATPCRLLQRVFQRLQASGSALAISITRAS